MLLLGIDIGTSFIKVAVIDGISQKCIAAAQYPDLERQIISTSPDFAEQSPEQWWDDVKMAVRKLNGLRLFDPKDIGAIGISYQMHGLVCVDKNNQLLRNSIIWCDSRAVNIGNKAFKDIGEQKCLSHLLNSPGNFTASKLKWVMDTEPECYEKIAKVMLPGDYISMKLTGESGTTLPALSEGMFWDFKNKELSKDIFNYFGFDQSLIPQIINVFSEHGRLSADVANELSLTADIPVSYKAGDQPNNALSLNVMNPGEVAATAGTSGVIYGITDQCSYDTLSRVNNFAHVNHTNQSTRIGTLLCINGTGILNRWVKNLAGNGNDYVTMNQKAQKIPIGSNGLKLFPFGNGAERMLNNRTVHSSLQQINFNIHSVDHVFRAAQEGIAFAFRYGFDILKTTGIQPNLIRAGNANMFLSNVFAAAFANTLNVPVELYDNDGSIGAALGAGIGAGIFKDPAEAFAKRTAVKTIMPAQQDVYETQYQQWLELLKKQIDNI